MSSPSTNHKRDERDSIMPKTDLNQMLKLFKISLQAEETPIFSIPMTDMVQASHMTRFVEAYAPMIQALEPGAAATSFCGWFGFLTAGLHYFLLERSDSGASSIFCILSTLQRTVHIGFRLRGAVCIARPALSFGGGAGDHTTGAEQALVTYPVGGLWDAGNLSDQFRLQVYRQLLWPQVGHQH